MAGRRHPRIIGILYSGSSSYGRVLSVAAFNRIRSAGFRPVITAMPFPEQRVFGGDVVGYIGFAVRGLVERLREQRVPVVNVSQSGTDAGFPSILPDSRLAGRQAAEHLLARGYTQLVYAPHAELVYSILRGAGARAAAVAAKARFMELPVTVATTDSLFWETQLPILPRPTGIVAADDTVGAAILEATPATRVRVPEQLAVVGITNDEIACGTAVVPLSSVDLNPAQIGDRAAQLILRLVAGRRPPAHPILIKPHGVVVRASSDALATSDPLFADIIQFAREHIAEGVTVDRLARQFGMSRRHLNRLFHQRLTITPLLMLRRLAVESAKHLLLNSDLSIPQVAARCGYDNVSHFTALFRQLTGTTPAVYRESR